MIDQIITVSRCYNDLQALKNWLSLAIGGAVDESSSKQQLCKPDTITFLV